VPFITLAGASFIVTLIAQRQGGAMSRDVFPLPMRIANAIWSIGRYLLKTVCPTRLSFFYPYYGVLPGTMIPIAGVIASAIVFIAITGVAIALWKRTRAALIGWLWFIVLLVPTLGLVQVGMQSMADRYTYLPHIGLIAGVVFAMPKSNRWLPVVAAVATIALAIDARMQLRYWHDDIALFSHALEVTDHNHTAHDCLALA